MRSSVAQIASERIDAFKRVDVPCARAYYYAYFEGVRAQTARRRSRHGIRIGTRRRQPGLSMRERTDSRGDRVRRRRDANLSHRPRIQPAPLPEPLVRGRQDARRRDDCRQSFFFRPAQQHLSRSGYRRRAAARRCGPARRSALRPGPFDGADERMDRRRARARMVLERARQFDLRRRRWPRSRSGATRS